MNIKKILIFIIYIILINILLFKEKNTEYKKEYKIDNIELYNSIQSKLNRDDDINVDLSNSYNKNVRFVNLLMEKYKNNINIRDKVVKRGDKKVGIKNKYLNYLQELNDISYIIITDDVEKINLLYDDRLLNIIVSFDKKFKIKLNEKVLEVDKCYYNSDNNIKLEIYSRVLFVQCIKSYGMNSIIKSVNSIYSNINEIDLKIK